MTSISRVGLLGSLSVQPANSKPLSVAPVAAKLKPAVSAAAATAAASSLAPTPTVVTQTFTPSAKALASPGSLSSATIPTSTGNANTDALLNGGTNFWWGNKTKDGGKTFTLSYSMLGAKLDSTASAKDAQGYKPMTATQKSAVTKALSYIASVINVKFVSGKSGTADLNFGTNNQEGVSAGYANYPNASGGHNSYIMLANDQATNTSPAPGNYGWQTIVHEIGHALGLKHPGDYNAGGGGGTPPYLSAGTDNQRNTIMSYNSPSDTSVYNYKLTKSAGGISIGGTVSKAGVYGFMQYDLEALQYLYGANTKVNGNGQVTSFSNTWKGLQTLWSPVANSKIDASKVTNNNIIDIRGGAFSSINIQPTAPADLAAVDQQYGSNFSGIYSSNNTYYGYNNVGVAKGSQISTVTGGTATDVIYANSLRSLTIDGGKGTDTVFLGGASGDWKATGKAGNQIYTNSVTKQKVTLKNVEAVKFYDMASADLSHSSVDLSA